MTSHIALKNRTVWLQICLLSVAAMQFCPAAARAKVLPIEVAANVDEKLYLTYVLNDLYSALPTDFSDAQKMENDLSALRLRGSRYYEYVKERNFDPKLTAIYADFITAIDHYTDFLVSIGSIQQQAADRVQEGQLNTSARAGAVGGATAVADYNNGASDGDAALAGLASAAITWAIESIHQNHEIAEARQNDLAAANAKFKDDMNGLVAKLDNAELDLATHYGWGKFETRSTDTEDDADAWNKLFAANDVDGLLALLGRRITVRPRDPMLLAVRCLVGSCVAHITPAAMRALAEQCLNFATLVPKGQLYDDGRAAICCMAGDIADRAWEKELTGLAWGHAHSSIAAYSVDVWDTALSYDPKDSTGENGERRAWSLMASGRTDDAVKQADEVKGLRRDTPRFAVDYAYLCDAIGDTKDSYKWFAHAVKDLHCNAIAEARTDPDLDEMRKAESAAFEDLVKVKYDWGVNRGVFHDDIYVNNNSAYPLTNVVFTCTITSGGQMYNPVLKADVIQPGTAYTWNNCVSISGSNPNYGTSEIDCDQNK